MRMATQASRQLIKRGGQDPPRDPRPKSPEAGGHGEARAGVREVASASRLTWRSHVVACSSLMISPQLLMAKAQRR